MRFEYADARMPIAMTKGGSTYSLAYDQVGSLRIVADASGNVIKRIDYDSFGNIINDTNPAFEIPFGFAGGLHDTDIGLVRFGYRDYDPDAGRWTAKDPVSFAGGDIDLYGYCINDPVNWFDPSGRWTYVIEYGTTGEGLTEHITSIENIVDNIFDGIASRDAIVTYTTNGTHSPNSLHYSGNAIDLRTRDLINDQINQITNMLSIELGCGYDVINEGSHIHIEYDPGPCP